VLSAISPRPVRERLPRPFDCLATQPSRAQRGGDRTVAGQQMPAHQRHQAVVQPQIRANRCPFHDPLRHLTRPVYWREYQAFTCVFLFHTTSVPDTVLLAKTRVSRYKA
jgi:hypothetical protein